MTAFSNYSSQAHAEEWRKEKIKTEISIGVSSVQAKSKCSTKVERK
jgi:hypothetical protein